MDKIIDAAIRHIINIQLAHNADCLDEIRDFCFSLFPANHCEQHYEDNDRINYDTKYCLVAAIDEAILSNHHLAASWVDNTVVFSLFGERNAGDRFYDIIHNYIDQQDDVYVIIKRACYQLLLFGFEGKNSLFKGIKESILEKLNSQLHHYSPIDHSIRRNKKTTTRILNLKNILSTLLCIIFIFFFYYKSYFYSENRKIFTAALHIITRTHGINF